MGLEPGGVGANGVAQAELGAVQVVLRGIERREAVPGVEGIVGGFGGAKAGVDGGLERGGAGEGAGIPEVAGGAGDASGSVETLGGSDVARVEGAASEDQGGGGGRGAGGGGREGGGGG